MNEVEENRIVDASFVAGAVTIASLPPTELPEVAFCGRSNVGKSSLLNALCQRKGLVRTSNTPGRTRALNVFRASLKDGLVLHLMDVPGYGYAKLSKAEKSTWGAMLETYLRERFTLRAAIVIIDIRRGIEEDDEQLIEFLRSEVGKGRTTPLEMILVATKLDKLPLAQRKPALMAFKKASGRKPIGFSAVTGEGRDEVWARIRHAVGSGAKASEPEAG